MNYMLCLWLLVALMSWSGSALIEITVKISVRVGKPDTKVQFV